MDPAETWQLGALTLDGHGKRLMRGGERIEADTQQVELLLHLVRAYPSIVGKDALIDGIWGGPYVTEAALQKTVSALRKTLREAGLPDDMVETRHRRGYQLTQAPVRLVPGETEAVVVGDADLNRPPPSPRRWSMVAAVMLILLAATIVVWRVWAPPASDAKPPPATPVLPRLDPGVHAARLQALDDEALLQALRDTLASDPEFARLAVQELRDRGSERPLLAALADKFEGILAYRAGAFEPARAHYERALSGFRALGDVREQANVLNNLGVLLSEAGREPDRAESLYREALALRESLGDAVAVMASHRNLSNLLLEQGQWQRAQSAVSAYAEAAERIGTPADRGEALLLRADVLRDSGQDARLQYREAAEFGVAQGLPMTAASAWQRLGRESLQRDEPSAARVAFESAIALYAQSDPGHQLPWLKFYWAQALAAEGKTDAAMAAYTEVLTLGEGLDNASLSIDARLGLVALLLQAGRDDEADGHLADASRQARLLGNPVVVANVALSQFEADLRRDQRVSARAQLEQARRALADGDHDALRREIRLREVILWIADGHHESARETLDELAADADVRQDLEMHRRTRQLRAMLAMSAGRFAEGYVLWRGGEPGPVPREAHDPDVPNSALPPKATAWSIAVLSAFLIGAALGFFWRRRYRIDRDTGA